MDIIFIRDLVMEATVGIHDHERSWPQSIQLNLDIAMPGSSACSSDRIGDTIDYSVVVESIRRALGLRRFNLLEALAECVASVVLDRFGAPWVRVEVAKGRVVPGVRLVGVLIERVRSEGTVNAYSQQRLANELEEID